MIFSRTHTTMEVLEERQEMTVVDVLNVFYDLCADIRDEQNIPVEKIMIGSEDGVVNRLAWMGRTFLRIARQISIDSIDSERRQRLEKVWGQLQQMQNELEEVDGRIHEEQIKKIKLKMDKEKLEESLRREMQLKQECSQMEQTICEYREMKIPGLESKWEALQGEMAVQEREIEHLNEQLLQLKQNVSCTNKRFLEAEQEKKEMENTMCKLRNQITAMSEEKRWLLDQTTRMQNEADDLENWFRNIEVEDCRKRLEFSRERINRLKTAREALEEELKLMCGLTTAVEKESLEKYQVYFKNTLNQIEKNLDQYQKCYCMAADFFERKGNGL